MSFWKNFGFMTTSAIDTILDSGEFTLEKLLDEDDILQETKGQNKKLLDFLSEPASLKKLVDYISVEPDQDADQKRKFKYPFLAAEILASEIVQLIDAFYQQTPLLDQLYSFLEKDPPLNPMLASYSSRVAGSFLQKKVPETITYLKSKKDVVGSFVKHLGNASVMDLLLKIISCEDLSEESKILEWLTQTDLIVSLVKKFDPANDEETIENASQAVVDIIAVSSRIPNSPLLAQLESEPISSTLFEYILSKGLNASLLHGLNVVVELLQRHFLESVDTTKTIDALPPFLQLVMKRVDALFAVLKEGSNQKKVTFTFGEIVPLGFHRLKVVEFFCALVRTNYKSITESLIKIGAVTSCLDLFFSYHWNNFLHSTVSTMVESILTCNSEELEIFFINETQFLEKIAQCAKDNEATVKKPKGFRFGNMGHITILSLLLLEKSQLNSNINKLLQENKSWKEYTAEGGALADIRKKESSTLGISDPYYEEGEEEEHFNLEEEEEEDETMVKNEEVDEPKKDFLKEQSEEKDE